MSGQRVRGPSNRPVLTPPTIREDPTRFPGFGEQTVETVTVGNNLTVTVRNITAADVAKCLLIDNPGPVVLQIPDVDPSIATDSIIDIVAMRPGFPAPTQVDVRGAGIDYTQYLTLRAQYSRARLQKVYPAGRVVEGVALTHDLWVFSGDLMST